MRRRSENNYDLRPCTFKEHGESIWDTWLRFPVGERYSYSNLGMDLVADAIERLAGKTFSDFVVQDMLAPLGITTATYHPGETCSLGHEGRHERRLVSIPMQGAGGLFISARYAARFVSFHLRACTVNGKPAIRADLLAEMARVQYAAQDQKVGYALGTAIDIEGDLEVSWHSCGGYGYSAMQAWTPKANLGVAMVLNQEESGDLTYPTCLRILRQLARCRGLGAAERPRPLYGGRTAISLGAAELSRFQGTFSDRSASFEVRERNGVLWMDGRPLRTVASGSFVTERGSLITFRMNSADLPTEMQVHMWDSSYNRYPVDHTPFDPPGPNKHEWKELVGVYRLADEDGDLGPQWTLVCIEDGYLCVMRGNCRGRLHECAPSVFFNADGESAEFGSGQLRWGGGMVLRREAVLPHDCVLGLAARDPDHLLTSWASLVDLAKAYRTLGKPEIVRRLLREGVRIHSPSVRMLYNLAQASHQAGDDDYAAELCRLVLGREPEHREATEFLSALQCST